MIACSVAGYMYCGRRWEGKKGGGEVNARVHIGWMGCGVRSGVASERDAGSRADRGRLEKEQTGAGGTRGVGTPTSKGGTYM